MDAAMKSVVIIGGGVVSVGEAGGAGRGMAVISVCMCLRLLAHQLDDLRLRRRRAVADRVGLLHQRQGRA